MIKFTGKSPSLAHQLSFPQKTMNTLPESKKRFRLIIAPFIVGVIFYCAFLSSVLLTSKTVNSCQEDQRPSGAGYFGGAEAPVANPGSGESDETKRIPMIYSTDLYQPPVDPDDHYDLAILASLEEFELKAIIFDVATPHRKPNEYGEAALKQMNQITSQPIPSWKVGLRAPLRAPDDKALDQPAESQGGVELILSTLEQSAEPVVMFMVGSCRDFAVAFHRNPELLRQKVKAVYVNAGNGPSGLQTEWNVTLDPNAYIGLMNSGLPIYWCPCFHHEFRVCSPEEVSTGKAFSTFFIVQNQAELLQSSRKEVKNYFAFALSGLQEEPVAFLNQETKPLPETPRNMWCTGPFLHAAGRKIYPTAQGKWIARSPEQAKSQNITGEPVEVYCFDPIITSVVKTQDDTIDQESSPCRFLDIKQDKVGKNAFTPDGQPDCHVRIRKIEAGKEINRIVITAKNNGRWESIPTDPWWRIAIERNENTLDCYFSPYTDGKHEIAITFADGSTQTFACIVPDTNPVFRGILGNDANSSATKVFRYTNPNFGQIMPSVLSELLETL